jgi:hypothetical protein
MKDFTPSFSKKSAVEVQDLASGIGTPRYTESDFSGLLG